MTSPRKQQAVDADVAHAVEPPPTTTLPGERRRSNIADIIKKIVRDGWILDPNIEQAPPAP